MHECPECGQACYCHGDIDDCTVETEEYSSMMCECPYSPDGCGGDDNYEDDDYYPVED